MTETRPKVADWATDLDHLDPTWGTDAHEIWNDLRERCPVAHTDRFHGAYLVTRYDDIAAVAYDTEHFSSRTVLVNEMPAGDLEGIAPPITSDPPEHAAARRMLLPAFAPRQMERWEPITREICRETLDRIGDATEVDAATAYAQHIPVVVIARMLGLPEEDGDQFRLWLHELLEIGPAIPRSAGARSSRSTPTSVVTSSGDAPTPPMTCSASCSDWSSTASHCRPSTSSARRRCSSSRESTRRGRPLALRCGTSPALPAIGGG